ncbi:MAG: nicotinate-nucleotide--dimethylbenzimidazole phosphoribosyltransferase [Actinomycetota bacterium]|nr:nicotinate-nucleotide--dimethylbenzimidazole phosphoribosyltransferase [Actinomycetota bacterium]
MAFEDRVRDLVGEVEPAGASAAEAARERQSGLLKPRGSLGRLEELGARLAGMAGAPPPVPENPAVVVCVGDHGVLARGVSPWPIEVTAAMVENFCAGGAAVNAVARAVGARVSVLDVGVASELDRHPLLRGAKVRPGTGDLSERPAMGREEAARAVLAGAGIAGELVESGGVDLLVPGDMGIGNTTPAACLIAAFTGRPAREVTGRGTGIDDATLERKIRIVEEALELHRPDTGDPMGTLAALGGLEHAALVGLILTGAIYRVPVLLDGIVSNSAALVARALAPSSVDYMIAGHLSAEPGARVALEKLGLEPLLDLDMRLGEGTGGLLAVPLVQAAARTLQEMATLDEAGIA